jgi:hypothetical protein
MLVEFHFQEGFSGEEAQLFANDTEIGHYQLKTRVQTGLAAIKQIEVDPAQEFRIALPGLGISKKFSIDASKKYVFVNLNGNEVTVTPANASPGYV